MADAALMLMASYTTATIATGNSPVPHGNQDPALAGCGSFETAAGTLMIGAFTNRQMSNLMRAVGDDVAADEIAVCPRAQIGGRQARDVAALTRVLQTKTADEWEVILNDHHVPAARVRRLDQALAEEHSLSRGVLQHAADGQNSTRLPVAAFSYDHGTPQLDHPPHAHGQDSRDILAAIGVENAEFEALKQQGVVG
jgi:crotonobetainyl-CoA:carnitine CoA-transferase CaiB-like acyl-CoA transferase